MWKQFLSDYLSFSKRDRNGIFIILALIAIFTLLPFLYPLFIKEKTYDHTAFQKAIDSLKTKQEDSSGSFENRYPDKRNYQNKDQFNAGNYNNRLVKGELFYFDPNTASADEWKRLGIRDKTIATIQNYLSKGGKFYKKEDLGKIWGLHKNEVDRLLPYVQISGANTAFKPKETQPEKKEYKKEFTIIDINTADTTALIALPGIGSKLAQRIINFRDKLGGFYKVEQVAETFGLADSTFQKIKPFLNLNPKGFKQININTASIDEMKLHPYIRYATANAIVQYRNQHGNYSAVEDLKKIMTITEEVFKKMAPYLTVH
jgi:competence ComEA-like helix-hairpin-helix protein